MTLAVVGYVLFLLLVWLILYVGGDNWWWATVMLFGPRWMAALPLLVLTPLAAIFERRLLLLLAAAAVLVGWPIMGWHFSLAKSAQNAPRDLRLLTYNIGGEIVGQKPSTTAIRRLLDMVRPDVVTLQECGISDEEFARQFSDYHVSSDNGACFLSHFPIVTVDARPRTDILAIQGAGIINRIEVATPRGIVSILNLHLATQRDGLQSVLARSAEAASEMRFMLEKRRVESGVARAWARRSQVPQIIAGDFNMPSESVIFRKFWGDLSDAFPNCGRGYGYTKWTRGFGIRIDHVLFDDRWRCQKAFIEKSVGGDHNPLIVDFSLR